MRGVANCAETSGESITPRDFTELRRHAHSLGECGELEVRTSATPPHPGLDELATDGVVAYLLRGLLLGFQDRRQRIIGAVPSAECTRCLQRVPDLALNGHPGSVNTGTEIDRELHIAEIHRGRHPVD